MDGPSLYSAPYPAHDEENWVILRLPLSTDFRQVGRLLAILLVAVIGGLLARVFMPRTNDETGKPNDPPPMFTATVKMSPGGSLHRLF